MIKNNLALKKRKKQRIDITTIKDFKEALKKEGYIVNNIDNDNFKKELINIFAIDDTLAEKIYSSIKDGHTTYRADNINNFITYIKNINLFEDKHNKLCKKLKKIKTLHIDRIEYDRETSIQENVDDILRAIEKMRIASYSILTAEEELKLEQLEEELSLNHIYSKDIELLKKIILLKNEAVKENYDIDTKIKTLSIEIPKLTDIQYIKPIKGSIEYHEHLCSNLPRMDRLINNIDTYMEANPNDEGTFKIDQSETLQDTINLAIATFNNKEFKAISGSNNVAGYCSAPPLENAAFECSKVNKLGKLGIGYKRVNDSEKKIFEEINKEIENGLLPNNGDLILYSKWQPCPSCNYVISQFCEKYPHINVHIKFSKKYGEKTT